MNTMKLAIILASSLIVFRFLLADYNKGLSLAVFMLILMPRELYFEVGGGLPTLTGYRAIILIVFFYSLYKGKLRMTWQKMPILTLLTLVLLTKLCSLLFAYSFMASFNGVLIFVLERFLFFIILIKSIENRESVRTVIRNVGVAVIIIAIFGLLERYMHFNPVDYISLSNNPRFEARMANEIYSTLPHPILFGAALAMGLPICLVLFDSTKNHTKKILFGIFTLLIIANIYFSNSRGPWLASAVAFFMLLSFNYPRVKIRLVPIFALMIIVLIMRPGVFDTIYGLSASTFDENSLEGGSFQYRFELIRVAFREITLAPERIAFGYGDNAANAMNITGTISYGTGREMNFWSWDNEFALLLLNNGMIGLTLHLVLYFYCLIYLIKRIRLVNPEDKRFMIALAASNSVLVFMATNVALFAPQLHFIFWTNMAVGAVLAKEQYMIVADKNGDAYLLFGHRLIKLFN